MMKEHIRIKTEFSFSLSFSALRQAICGVSNLQSRSDRQIPVAMLLSSKRVVEL
jgi:hypothetical protein